MRILFLGDVVGRPGRYALKAWLPSFRRENDIAFVIANGENAAAGFGITRKIYQELLEAQVDCVTSGNHIFAQKEVETWIGDEVRLLRPANYPSGVPGSGMGVYENSSGVKVAVVNLCGRVFMQTLDCPFAWADRELPALREQTPILIVDFHAEATSEKQAFARYVDGKVTAVIGTHTHVQTADEQLLPGGTAYVTDCGMTGPIHSVIGTNIEAVLAKYRTQMPRRFTVGSGPVDICGVLLEVNEATGKATSIRRLQQRHEEVTSDSEQ